MNQIIAMHGWCGDSTFWENWEDHFKLNGWQWRNSERGYGHLTPSEPFWMVNAQENHLTKKVIFCHSLGIHLISSKVLKEASHIVLLNSFSRFIPKGRESRSIKTALNGMQKHLNKATERAMLLKFIQKANQPYKENYWLPELLKNSLSPKGRKMLSQDLELLINTKGLPPAFPKTGRVLVINGGNDHILSSVARSELLDDLSNHLNQSPLNWIIKDEGHNILCIDLVDRINNWLKAN
ncbi:alpha/beta hydrolase [Prochlorococcus marinus]|uniref:alpha/beta hydrolase n=1 Tax=Prochlorococcus marinus TaxID=1219 RepID=UPI0022B3A694|nr:alpha/beta hydrolase [Prochlorococcus marinus]